MLELQLPLILGFLSDHRVWVFLLTSEETNKYITGCLFCQSVGRSGEDESQEDVLMDEAPSNISQASTLQANREGKTVTHQNIMCPLW